MSLQTGFNHNITGLSIVVSEQEGGKDQKINFSYDPNNFEKQYTLEHIKYVQYVRIITTTEGMVFDEVEVFGLSKYKDADFWMESWMVWLVQKLQPKDLIEHVVQEL